MGGWSDGKRVSTALFAGFVAPQEAERELQQTTHVRRLQTDDRGFSLLETLIGTTLVVVAVWALVHLFVLSARANARARDTTFSAVLAAEKMEQLRGLTWGFDVTGLPTGDSTTDITVSPERTGGGTGLNPSPSGSLLSNTAGYCDFLDARGHPLGSGTSLPEGAVYIRRWAIEPLPADRANALVLQVRVIPRAASQTDSVGLGRLPGEVRLLSVKTRKAD